MRDLGTKRVLMPLHTANNAFATCLIKFICLILCLSSYSIHAAPTLLGPCSPHGSGSADCSRSGIQLLPGQMLSHTSVSLDVTADGTSRIAGNAMHLDVGLLTVTATGLHNGDNNMPNIGKFTIAPTHAQYQDVDGNVIALTSNAGRLHLHYNNRPILQYAPIGKAFPTVHRWIMGVGAIVADDLLVTNEGAAAAICAIARLSEPAAQCATVNSSNGTGASLAKALTGIAAALQRAANNGGAAAAASNVASPVSSPAGVSESHLKLLIRTTEDTLRGESASRLVPVNDRLDKLEQSISAATGKVLGDAREFAKNEIKGLLTRLTTLESLNVGAHMEIQTVASKEATAAIESLSAKLNSFVLAAETKESLFQALEESQRETVTKVATVFGQLRELQEDLGYVSSAYTMLNSSHHVQSHQMLAQVQDMHMKHTNVSEVVSHFKAQTETRLSELGVQANETSILLHRQSNSLVELLTLASNHSRALRTLNETLLGHSDTFSGQLAQLHSSWNESVEAMQLSINAAVSNCSGALARSNGILTRAIAEVNVTLWAAQAETEVTVATLRSETADAVRVLQINVTEELAETRVQTRLAARSLGDEMQTQLLVLKAEVQANGTALNAAAQSLEASLMSINSTLSMRVDLLEGDVANAVADLSGK